MHSTTIRRTERKRRARKRAFSTIPPTPDGCSSNARTDPASPSSDVRPHSRDARTRSLRFSDARIFPLSQAPSYGNRNRPSEQRQQRAGRRQVHGTVVARRSQTRDGRRDTARSCIFISSFRESSVSLSALGLAWTLPRALAGILKFRYQRSRILDLERVALHDYRIGNIRFSKISIIISTLMSRLALPMSCPVAQRTCFELARNHPTSANADPSMFLLFAWWGFFRFRRACQHPPGFARFARLRRVSRQKRLEASVLGGGIVQTVTIAEPCAVLALQRPLDAVCSLRCQAV